MIKKLCDMAANKARQIEENFDSSAVIVEGIDRSLQLDRYSCGVQSCYMILRFYGKVRSIEKLERDLGTDEDGTGEEEILNLFREKELRVRINPCGTIKDICRAVDSSAPMLASTINKHNHWFVIYGYSDSRIYILDPSLKKSLLCSMPRKDFRRYWSGWCAAVYGNRKRQVRKVKR